MKVLFLSHSGFMGGAERALLELVQELRERGVQCYVLLPYWGPLGEEFKKRNITFKIIKYRSWMCNENAPYHGKVKGVLVNIIMAFQALLYLKRLKCDIVYTNTLTICTGAILSALTGKPHIWHIHEHIMEDHGIKFCFGRRLSLFLLNKYSTILLTVSKCVENTYSMLLSNKRIETIYQSVTVRNEHQSVIKSEKYKCAVIGKVTRGKNQEDAVRVTKILKDQGLDMQLYIVGGLEVEYAKYLVKIIRDSDIKKQVHFVGQVANAFPYMIDTDVTLVCSRSESFGRVTVEGMLAGRVVIGTNVGGTAELIQDGITGYLYEPGDIGKLASILKYLYENPDIRKRVGEQAKLWAAPRFTKERYAEEVHNLLKECM